MRQQHGRDVFKVKLQRHGPLPYPGPGGPVQQNCLLQPMQRKQCEGPHSADAVVVLGPVVIVHTLLGPLIGDAVSTSSAAVSRSGRPWSQLSVVVVARTSVPADKTSTPA